MTEWEIPITAIRLARSRAGLVAGPVACLVVGTVAVAGGFVAGGPARIGLLALGGLAALVAAYLLALVSSYRLQVEPGVLRLRWFGGERRYRLVRGPVTRVAVSGDHAAALHARFGALGWAVGPAVLRGEEPIELIRLSTRGPLILVPTNRGRLAIAAQVERDLLAALSSAVRLQERLEAVASLRAAPPAAVATVAAEPAAPRILTGIERALLEQRLAAERAASLAVADTERHAASAVVAAAAATTAPTAPAVAAATTAPTAPAVAAATTAPTAPAVAPVASSMAAPAPARRRERARWQRPAWLALPEPASAMAALPIAVPLVGAGIAWIVVAVTGRPALPIAEARLLMGALLLVGPVGAAGALIARAWYPRLGGLVAASSLAALAMLARTILA